MLDLLLHFMCNLQIKRSNLTPSWSTLAQNIDKLCQDSITKTKIVCFGPIIQSYIENKIYALYIQQVLNMLQSSKIDFEHII